jgi:DnaK suppressor protein
MNATKQMTATRISNLKQLLENRRKWLIEEIRLELTNSGEQSHADLAGSVSDFGDNSVADMLIDVNIATIDRQVHELRDIESTLVRIGQFGYGNCSECGMEIGYDRLKLQPTATRCVPCQTNYERIYGQDHKNSI